MKYVLSLSILLVAALLFALFYEPEPAPVYVGVLHSLTGTMAESERPVMEATLLAIEHINANGGIMGKKLIPIVEDGASAPLVFAEKAEYLITQKNVKVIFGCWTSACRKQLKPIVELHGNLLMYPVQYEGLETSPNIVYLGATPNQQIVPAVSWSLQHLGSRVYLVGSDYIFPRIANWLIRKQVALLGGTVVGERYIGLGKTDVRAIIKDLKKTPVDVVFNTINSDSLRAFFHAYEKHWNAKTLPVMSFSFGEAEIQSLDLTSAMVGNYVASNYFQSIKSDENKEFIRLFHQRYGNDRTINDAMASAWNGVHLWADAALASQSCNPDNVLATIRHRSLLAPCGVVSIDHHSLHTWKTTRIGKANSQGQFDIVWQSQYAIQPTPFPLMINQQEGKNEIETWYHRWNQRWIAP